MKANTIAVAIFTFFFAGAIAAQSSAQPAPPRTKVEAFEAQEGAVIVQGFSRIGELRGSLGGSVAVLAKEFTNATTGRREAGVAIDVKEGGRLERSNRAFIDYEEIAPLLKGLEYLAKVQKSVTKLDSFQADYRTRGDFRVSTFSTSGGEVMVAITAGRIGQTSVHLKFSDLASFGDFVSSAKQRLDSAK